MTHIQLLPTEPLEVLPIPEPSEDARHFYSEDATQLIAWLYAGRGPTCTGNPLLLEMVRSGYTGRLRGEW